MVTMKNCRTSNPRVGRSNRPRRTIKLRPCDTLLSGVSPNGPVRPRPEGIGDGGDTRVPIRVTAQHEAAPGRARAGQGDRRRGPGHRAGVLRASDEGDAHAPDSCFGITLIVTLRAQP